MQADLLLVLCRMHETAPDLAAQHLNQAFARMLPLLIAAQEEVRQGAAGAMKNLVNDCLDSSSLAGEQREALTQLENGLGATHEEAWPAVLSGMRRVDFLFYS